MKKFLVLGNCQAAHFASGLRNYARVFPSKKVDEIYSFNFSAVNGGNLKVLKGAAPLLVNASTMRWNDLIDKAKIRGSKEFNPGDFDYIVIFSSRHLLDPRFYFSESQINDNFYPPLSTNLAKCIADHRMDREYNNNCFLRVFRELPNFNSKKFIFMMPSPPSFGDFGKTNITLDLQKTYRLLVEHIKKRDKRFVVSHPASLLDNGWFTHSVFLSRRWLYDYETPLYDHMDSPSQVLNAKYFLENYLPMIM